MNKSSSIDLYRSNKINYSVSNSTWGLFSIETKSNTSIYLLSFFLIQNSLSLKENDVIKFK